MIWLTGIDDVHKYQLCTLAFGLFHLHSRYLVQILVHSLLALEAIEPVSELVAQMALELINNPLISLSTANV